MSRSMSTDQGDGRVDTNEILDTQPECLSRDSKKEEGLGLLGKITEREAKEREKGEKRVGTSFGFFGKFS